MTYDEIQIIAAEFKEVISFGTSSRFYQEVAAWLQKCFDADRVFVGVHRKGDYEFENEVTTVRGGNFSKVYSLPSWGQVIVNFVMSDGKSLRTRFPQMDIQLGYQPTYAVDYAYPGFSEALCSPLMVNGSCEGIIYVHFDRGRVDFQDWTEPGLACLDELARILSIAIEIRGI